MARRPLILGALLLAAFLTNVDTTIVNVALPTLVRELHATTSQLQWIVDAYNLVFAAFVLAAGSVSDRLGRKGMLLTGLGLFGVASVAGGISSSPNALIAARCFMGLGAAVIFPATLSLIANVFTERRERALAIGLWGALSGWLLAHEPGVLMIVPLHPLSFRFGLFMPHKRSVVNWGQAVDGRTIRRGGTHVPALALCRRARLGSVFMERAAMTHS